MTTQERTLQAALKYSKGFLEENRILQPYDALDYEIGLCAYTDYEQVITASIMLNGTPVIVIEATIPNPGDTVSNITLANDQRPNMCVALIQCMSGPGLCNIINTAKMKGGPIVVRTASAISPIKEAPPIDFSYN